MGIMNVKQGSVVVGIGEILWDMLPSGKQLGGAPANFAYFARGLGAEACVVSRVGNDDLGREILARLNDLGFDGRSIALDRSHPTGVVNIRLDRRGKPAYEIKTGAAWDFMRSSAHLVELAKKTKAVCFGTLAQRSPVSRKTIMNFIRSTDKSALKVFDINLRQSFYNRALIHRLLAMANILKLNDEELKTMASLFKISGNEHDIAAHLLRKYKLRMVALTRGAEGATLFTGEEMYSAKGHPVRVADTVGAGDSFSAGLVMGLLGGLPMQEVVELANRLAEYVCGQPGATPRIPAGIMRSFNTRAPSGCVFRPSKAGTRPGP